MHNEAVINVKLSRLESVIKQVVRLLLMCCANPSTKIELATRRWLTDLSYCTWSALADMSQRLCLYIDCGWQRLLFKTSLAFFCALDICDEAVGVIENLSHPFPPQLKWKPDREEKRVAGHSSFHHLSTTHAWLKGLCKHGGLHHLYQAPSKIKRQAEAMVNIDKAST